MCKMQQFVGLLLTLVLVETLRAQEAPVVDIQAGKVSGEWLTTEGGRRYASFNGIPYAKAPAGRLRFLRPQKPEPWPGVRQATSSVACVQRNVFKVGSPVEGQEDCLVVNVNTPSLPGDAAAAAKRLAVMVFIHGGGYVAGSGSRELYGAETFMDRDVVLVTINYRISVMGSFYMDPEKVVGNQGMWDQLLALKWVRDNIGSFGGDSSKVTIFGESAGAMSVLNHVLSPQSKGLFRAAIAQSGAPLSPFVGADKHPRHYSQLLAEKLGCAPRATDEEVLDCLEKVPVEELQSQAYMFEKFVRAPFPFKPIVDGGLVNNPFLAKEPLDLLVRGEYNHVPLIMGTNRDEGLIIKAFFMRNETNFGVGYDNWESIGPLAFFHREEEDIEMQEVEIALNYLKKHFAGLKFSKEGQGSDALVQMYGDVVFAAPADMTARIMSGVSQKPVYQYLYNHVGAVSLYEIIVQPSWKLAIKFAGMPFGLDLFSRIEGVSHGDELFMMFKTGAVPFSLLRSEQDRSVSNRLLAMWTDFAKHLNPTPETGTWERFKADSPSMLVIGSDDDKMDYPDDFKTRMEEWRDIWEKVPPLMRNMKSKTWSLGSAEKEKEKVATLPAQTDKTRREEL